MATILEKANQILNEKNTKLLPENLKAGITCLGVDGALAFEIKKFNNMEELLADTDTDCLKMICKPTVFGEPVQVGDEMKQANYIAKNFTLSEPITEDTTWTMSTVPYNSSALSGSCSVELALTPTTANLKITMSVAITTINSNWSYVSEDGIHYHSASSPEEGYVNEKIKIIGISMYLGTIESFTGEINKLFTLQPYDGYEFKGIYEYKDETWQLITTQLTGTASEVLQGHTVYTNGGIVEGTIIDGTNINTMINVANDETGIILKDDEQRIELNSDVYQDVWALGGGHSLGVHTTYNALANKIGITPEKIVKGNSILGVEGTHEGGSSGIKLFETVEEMNADENPIPDGKALVYRKNLVNIPANTHFTKLYFPETIILPRAVSENISQRINIEHEYGGGSTSISISPTAMNADFHLNMNMADVVYSSEDGITYTRKGVSVYNEYTDEDYWEFTEDVLCLKPGTSYSEGYYMYYSSINEANADVIQPWLRQASYGYYGLYINTGTSDNTKVKMIKNMKLNTHNSEDEFDWSFDYDSSYDTIHADVKAVVTAVRTLWPVTWCLVEKITDTIYRAYSYTYTSNAQYGENCDPLCLYRIDGSMNCHIGFTWALSNTPVPSFKAYEVDISTNAITDISDSISIKSFTTSSATVYYTEDAMNPTHYFTKVYYGNNQSNNALEPIIPSSTDSTGYTGWFIPMGYGKSYSYALAETQFDATSEYLFNGQVAYGSTGEIVGTLSKSPSTTFGDANANVYNKLQKSYDEMEPVVITNSDSIDKNIYCIPTKSDGTLLLDLSTKTELNGAFSGCKNLTYVPSLNTQNATRMDFMFNECSNLTRIDLLDTAQVTNMQGMFSNCTNLITVPAFNTAKCTYTPSMFDQCSKLVSVPWFDTSKVTAASSMFNLCYELVDVPAFNMSSCTSMGYMFQYCNKLSDNSLNNILAMCATTTSAYTSTKTLAALKLTEEQAIKCTTLSNYQAFLDAGWTTGY